MPTRNLSKLGGLQICQLGTCPSSVVCRSWLDLASAFTFLSQTCTRQCRTIDAHWVLTWWLCFICLQNACMMLLIVVPLIWFACLLFVFFSERFPFICRAGFSRGEGLADLCLGRCWANFCCYLQCFGHPDPKTKAINIFKIEPKLASCWRPKIA